MSSVPQPTARITSVNFRGLPHLSTVRGCSSTLGGLWRLLRHCTETSNWSKHRSYEQIIPTHRISFEQPGRRLTPTATGLRAVVTNTFCVSPSSVNVKLVFD